MVKPRRSTHTPHHLKATLAREQQMPPKPNFSYLKQRHPLFGSREFIIKSKDALLIREKSLLRHHETLIPLHTLQANPTHSSSFAVKWLLTGLFTFSLTGLTIYLASIFSLPALFIFSTVLAGTTLVLLYRFLLFTTKLTIFRHSVSNENYLYLWRNQPDKNQFESFVTELSQLIKDSQEKERKLSPHSPPD